MDNKIKTLRTFFRISNAAFEFQNSIQLAFSGHITPSKMHQLHKMALVEIEKENPDLSLIDKLLVEMESTVEQMKLKPEPPLSRVLREGVGRFCTNCGSTVSKDGFLGLFGEMLCHNQKCPNSKSKKNYR